MLPLAPCYCSIMQTLFHCCSVPCARSRRLNPWFAADPQAAAENARQAAAHQLSLHLSAPDTSMAALSAGNAATMCATRCFAHLAAVCSRSLAACSETRIHSPSSKWSPLSTSTPTPLKLHSRICSGACTRIHSTAEAGLKPNMRCRSVCGRASCYVLVFYLTPLQHASLINVSYQTLKNVSTRRVSYCSP
jgi:hypothetical protein